MQMKLIYFGGVLLSFVLSTLACVLSSWGGWSSRSYRWGRLTDLDYWSGGIAIIAFTIIGVILLGVATICEIIMLAVKSMASNKVLKLVSLICCGVGAICFLLALCIFGDRIGYGGCSLWMLSMAVVLSLETFIIGLLLFLGVISGS